MNDFPTTTGPFFLANSFNVFIALSILLLARLSFTPNSMASGTLSSVLDARSQTNQNKPPSNLIASMYSQIQQQTTQQEAERRKQLHISRLSQLFHKLTSLVNYSNLYSDNSTLPQSAEYMRMTSRKRQILSNFTNSAVRSSKNHTSPLDKTINIMTVLEEIDIPNDDTESSKPNSRHSSIVTQKIKNGPSSRMRFIQPNHVDSKRTTGGSPFETMSQSPPSCQHIVETKLAMLPGCVPKSILTTRCQGSCHSRSVPDWIQEQQNLKNINHCTCCSPNSMRFVNIRFQCPRRNTRVVVKRVAYPFRCSCRPCANADNVEAEQAYDYD